MIRPGDKRAWVDRCMGDDYRARAQQSFPLIDATTPRQAFGFYWEYYQSVMAKIAGPVFHMEHTSTSTATSTPCSTFWRFQSVIAYIQRNANSSTPPRWTN